MSIQTNKHGKHGSKCNFNYMYGIKVHLAMTPDLFDRAFQSYGITCITFHYMAYSDMLIWETFGNLLLMNMLQCFIITLLEGSFTMLYFYRHSVTGTNCLIIQENYVANIKQKWINLYCKFNMVSRQVSLQFEITMLFLKKILLSYCITPYKKATS